MSEREVFEAAIQIADQADRDRFVELACGGNAPLRAKVEELLRLAAQKTTDLLPPGAGSPGPHAGSPGNGSSRSSRADDPLVGQSIGGVKLVRLINEGGMGRVYEGRQENPRRTVAVKLVKPGVATEKLLRRFEFEAQVLARLRHPGIAEIFYAGTFGEGGATQPFFVMEYIAGAKPLTRYAADLKLSTHDRLELFRKVCDAVAHGHHNGVIHRDLKPSNILVDATGQPKVIDFGVAKTTDSDMALTTLQTDVGALIGTYQYMSPEQFDADPHAIDIRSDVYALGVVLYELLAGQPPYDLRRKLVHEIGSIVKQQDPTPLTNVNKTLRRDVGIIAGKCLEKDRNRRYSSAGEVAADVGRYLAGDPIAAVAPSAWDALMRVAKRHKAAATTVVAVAASLLAAVVGISVFAVRARQQERAATLARESEAEQRVKAEDSAREAQAERERAEAEATTAKRQLYAANLYKLQAMLDRTERKLAKDFFWKTFDSFKALQSDSVDMPVELRALGPELDGSIHVLEGHVFGVTDICFSPDGKRLGTASFDRTARFWDASTGTELAVLEGHESSVTSICFSPDGKRLATASDDKTARLWYASTGTELVVLEGHEERLTSICFSPDGKRLATASADRTARLWDASTGTELAVLRGHDSHVVSICFSPDGERLATASVDRTARLWDASRGMELAVLKGHENGINEICFSPDGKRLATASGDGTARLWDVSTGTELAVVKGHKYGVTSICFSPDGERLATAGDYARLWDASSGMELAVLKGHDNSLISICFSPDGKRLATVSWDETARLWDASTGTELAVFQGHGINITSICFSPDGERLATASADKTARLWDASAGTELAVLKGHEDGVSSICFSPDGKRLATAGDDARLWDASTGTELAVIRGHQNFVTSICFSPDGKRLATASADRTARLWDASTGTELAVLTVLKGHEDRAPVGANLNLRALGVTSICFSPDGKRLATASADRTARLWDASTGRELAVLKGHERSLTSICFSLDGERLATAGDDARLWDASTGTELAVLTGHKGIVTTICFSPDGKRLATASEDNTVRLWDASAGTELAVLKGHESSVTSICFSPDGERLATASHDKTARLWDASTGTELAVLEGHESSVKSICFSPDGKRLATASEDKTARLWGLSNAEIYSNRLAAAERRTRLGPIVDAWFTGDLEAVKARLAAAKATMPPEDWHEAGNLVLIKAQERLQQE